MFEVREKPQQVERAFLLGAYFDRRDEQEAESLVAELADLVDTLGIQIQDKRAIFVRDQNKAFLTGVGKRDEIIELLHAEECDCLIFDNALSPLQQKNWEAAAEVTVIDREEVILDIFAMRAQTKEARLQVELARMQYALPRMAKMWAHLDRQGGGAGGGKGGGAAARGEGEKQIEVDRRLARERIERARRELAGVQKQRATQRKEREKNPIPHAAIVGYTNAGKSTLLNTFTDSDVLAKDMLFATLDPTTRRIELPDGQAMLLTDTVGFVRNLPHRLVQAFKATLEEALLADFLIHVLDASSPSVREYHETTLQVLEELGAEDKRMIIALNKIDQIEEPSVLHSLQQDFPGAVYLSLKSGEGKDTLLHAINDMLVDRVQRLDLRIPQSRGDILHQVHREGKVLSEEYEGNDVLISAVIPTPMLHLFAPFRIAS
ncbi:MAG: GTPase HflX [Verrucomicrobiota bacterium]